MLSSLLYALLTVLFFFFNDTATTEIYTLSLHDALPISPASPTRPSSHSPRGSPRRSPSGPAPACRDRKSTRLNSSHGYISYAVFCLKKKNTHVKHGHETEHQRRIRFIVDLAHALDNNHR